MSNNEQMIELYLKFRQELDKKGKKLQNYKTINFDFQ